MKKWFCCSNLTGEIYFCLFDGELDLFGRAFWFSFDSPLPMTPDQVSFYKMLYPDISDKLDCLAWASDDDLFWEEAEQKCKISHGKVMFKLYKEGRLTEWQ